TSAGLLAGDGSLATVDTATAAPQGDARPEDAADLASDVGVVPLADGADVEAPLPVQERPAADPEPLAPQRPVAAAEPEPEAPAPARPEPPKPEPAAAPARLPAATAGGDYAVNFGAYGSRADAGTVVNRLRQSNLPAYVEETRVGDRDAWRVRIGPYASDRKSTRLNSSHVKIS